jgi:CheY-like chemotaxis protein
VSTILVIDDDQQQRRLLASVLDAEGYATSVAGEAATARWILVIEPDPDVRALIELVIRRLGHEPVSLRGQEPEPRMDAAVIEPGADPSLVTASLLGRRGTGIVFASIYTSERAALDLKPAAYLLKPFSVPALETALAVALAITDQ